MRMTMTRRIVQGFPAWEHSSSHNGASYPKRNDSTHMCQQISVSPLFSTNRLRNPWPWGVVPLFIDLESISAWNRPLLGYWDQHTLSMSFSFTHTQRKREREYNTMLNVLHSNPNTVSALKHDAKAEGVRETQSTFQFISVSINATM